ARRDQRRRPPSGSPGRRGPVLKGPAVRGDLVSSPSLVGAGAGSCRRRIARARRRRGACSCSLSVRNNGGLRSSPANSLVASESSDSLGGLLRCPPSPGERDPSRNFETSRLRILLLLSGERI
ncbi:hypothetical protein BDA96_07G038800, partial [Sorghum bicolor]